MLRHTIEVRPAMHYIGPGPRSGHKADEPQGYEVEFYRAGDCVQIRAYSYSDIDERAMLRRITDWVRKGEIL